MAVGLTTLPKCADLDPVALVLSLWANLKIFSANLAMLGDPNTDDKESIDKTKG